MVLQRSQPQGQVIGELNSTSASKESSYFLLILPASCYKLAGRAQIHFLYKIIKALAYMTNLVCKIYSACIKLLYKKYLCACMCMQLFMRVHTYMHVSVHMHV